MDAAFRAAEAHGIRAILGKVMMDRITYDPTIEPSTILDRTLRESRRPDRALARGGRRAARLRGHAAVRGLVHGGAAAGVRRAGRARPGRGGRATCPRIRGEIAEVARLFPGGRATTSTSTTGPARWGSGRCWPTRSTSPTRELARIVETGTRVSHCPASNLFIGAGVMPLSRWLEAGVVVGLGSDVSGGPDPSIFGVMRAGAYLADGRCACWLDETRPPLAPARLAPARDARRGAGAWARRPDRVARGGQGGRHDRRRPGDDVAAARARPEADAALLEDPAALVSRLIFRAHRTWSAARGSAAGSLEGPS